MAGFTGIFYYKERKATMNEEEVKIVHLPAMRVASVTAFGPAPEDEAWKKLEAFAQEHGFLDTLEIEHRIFGFNNPNPSPGSPNYGYEFWVKVGPEIEGPDVKQFPGGTYAVLRWDGMGNPYETIPAAWQRLVQWGEKSRYRLLEQLCLEEHIHPDHRMDNNFMLDLYLPVVE
jgi:effector-binding domain-containing protein